MDFTRAHPKYISETLGPPDIQVCLPDTMTLQQVWYAAHFGEVAISEKAREKRMQITQT